MTPDVESMADRYIQIGRQEAWKDYRRGVKRPSSSSGSRTPYAVPQNG